MTAEYVQLPQFADERSGDTLAPEKSGPSPIRGSKTLWEKTATLFLAIILVVNLMLVGGSVLASRKLSTTVNELRRADDVSTLPQPDPLVGLKGHPVPEWSSACPG